MGIEKLKRQNLTPAVIVVKLTSTSKLDIETSLCKTAQLVTKCCYSGIEVIDIIATFGGAKDINKRIGAITDKEDIQLLLLYSGKEIAQNEQEFIGFTAAMQDYGLKVLCYK